MSSAATTAFLDAWRALDAERVALAKIELSVPSALTLHYATSEVLTPDGQPWEVGLGGDSIRVSLSLLDPGVSPAAASIRLAKRRDANQSSGTLHDLLSDYLFQNAAVTIYLWERSLTDFADAFQIYKGNVSRPAEVGLTGLTLHLLQDLSWNVQTPPKVVDKATYPDSPDVSQGMAIPIVYGDHIAPPMRSPWTSTYGGKQYQENSGGGGGVVPGVLVDAGVGAAAVKVVYAGHECKDLLDRANGYSQFIVGEGLLAPLDTSGVTEVLASTDSYISIADENAIAYAAVIPIDVRSSAGGNTATDPRKAMDVFDETTFATLNQTTGKNELQLVMPNLSPLGRIESVTVAMGYKGDAANTQNLRVNAYTPGVGAGGFAPASFTSTNSSPGVAAGIVWPTNYWTQNWDFGGSNTVYDLRVDFVGAVANNKASIYWIALVVKYRPQRSVVTPGKQVIQLNPRTRVPGQNPNVGYNPKYNTFRITDIAPSYRLDSQFYANIKGQPDDGSGTYTGSAAALIERAPDIARHFLETYAGVASGDIETGSTSTGSFVLARSVLRNASPSDLKMACWIGDRTTVQRVLQNLCEQSGLCIYLDRFTDKWLCHPWKTGAVADYDLTFSWDANDISAFECEETSVVDVRHAIRVKYGYDHFKNRTAYEAWVNPGGSGQGISLPTIRDQRLTVSASNNKVDWKHGAVTWAATLTSATYSPIDLASEVRSKMRAASGASVIDCGHGFTIKTGYNDIIDWIDTSTYAATLDPGEYTAEGLADAVAVLMKATSNKTYTVTYDHSTNKFTVTGTSVGWTISAGRFGASYTQSAWHTMGYYSDITSGAGTSITSTYERYRDRFWLVCVSNPPIGITDFNLLWSTGANAASNCAYLLGYDKTDSGVVNNDMADYTRGDRERVAETYEGYYGPREERQITADWIRDEKTAVELRDRIFDLTGKPRVVVRFSTMRAPDIRRMQVIQFSSDLDTHIAFPKYGSNGSWLGKRFRVLEVEQDFTTTFHTEVLAIEAD